jgi:hypothetical protein
MTAEQWVRELADVRRVHDEIAAPRGRLDRRQRRG